MYLLDGINQKAITIHYLNGATIEITASLMSMTTRGAYYRIEIAIKEMAYIIKNIA